MDAITPDWQYQLVSVTVPARTNSATTALTLRNGWLDSVSILFAPGHNGLTGVRLFYNGNVILPWDGVGTYIIGSAERLNFDVGMYVPAPITIDRHNADNVQHQHVITFRWKPYQQIKSGIAPADFPTVIG